MSADIRMRFSRDERISPDVSPFVRAFLCGGHGVLLLPSYYIKKTVQFVRIEEDDGYWFGASGEIGGAADLRSLTRAMNAAYVWCLRKAIMDEDYGCMIAMINNKTKRVPLGEVAGKLKMVDPDSQMIKEAKRTGISFGD